MQGAAARGFVLDLNRCTGCDACSLACTIENSLEPGVSWRQVHTFNEPRYPALPVYHLSLACNHCAQAPCMSACPALAYTRDATTGAVLLDAERCIGCGYCRWACPFDAPRLDTTAGVMTKCTLCNHRLGRGEEPACVVACPTDTLGYGDLAASGLEPHVPGFPQTRIAPALRFVPLASHRAAATAHPVESTVASPAPSRPAAATSSLGTEWPLALFTLVVTGLVGWLGAALFASVSVDPLIFLAAAVLGGSASALHLGRPGRAWRALLNVRHSWLSREIAAYTAFVATSALALLLAPQQAVAWWLAVAAGLVCLFTIDRVYDVARGAQAARVHSADALPTGLFVMSILAALPSAALLLGGLKALLYGMRKLRDSQAGRRAHPGVGAARLALGFGVPLTAWLLGLPAQPAWILAGVAAGEIIDRLEFYAELDVPGPRGQIAIDLRRDVLDSRCRAAGAGSVA